MQIKRLDPILQCTALLAFAALFLTPALALAQPFVGQLVVKLRPDARVQGASTLSEAERKSVETALGMQTHVLGATRDGASRLALDLPMSLEQARAAVNRVRMLDTVLYANIAMPATSDANVAAGGAASGQDRADQPPIAQMIVKYRDPALQQASAQNIVLGGAQLGQLSATAGQPVAYKRAMSGGAYVVSLFQAIPIDQADALANTWEADPAIEYAQPDQRKYPMMTPNDPDFGLQWDLYEPAGGINMPAAWDITTGSASIVVAVVDTGILPHPDLLGRYLAGYDMISNVLQANDGNARDSNPSDPGDWITTADSRGAFKGCPVDSSSWHGTHVSGTLAAIANNSTGVAGINWISMILPVRVLGKCGGASSDVNDGIVWASGGAVPGVPANPTPARVINLSLGGPGSCTAADQAAINTALANGAVLAVAAGNSAVDLALSPQAPAVCNGVITVAATGRSGQRASFSNYGTPIEIAAPGGDFNDGFGILSTLNTGTDDGNLNLPDPPDLTASGWVYINFFGTSQATPHVAGVASLMLAVNPALTPAQIASIIQTTARAFPVVSGIFQKFNCTSGAPTANAKYCGAGILNAAAAVAAAAATAAAPTSTALNGVPNPSNVGQNVVFTATVTGTNPTGSVAFTEGASTIGACSTVILNSGSAQCSTSALTAGVHGINATYSGDSTNRPSSGTTLQTVIGLPTSTAVVGAPNPSSTGQSVTFTATVTGTTPTGTVMFTNGANAITNCSTVSLTGGGSAPTAKCITSALSSGAHTINVTYSGDASSSPSSGSVQQTVSSPPPPTMTKVVSSLDPSHFGQSVTFTATVTGASPIGGVSFTGGNVAIAGCAGVPLGGGGNSPTATCTTSALGGGTQIIKATYSGDGANAASAGSVMQKVQR